MKILFLGDIVGRSGREGVKKAMPILKEKFSPDIAIANADNAAHGFGINKTTAEELFSQKIDVLTGGNHIWDQKDSLNYISQSQRLLRPYNYPNETPGIGFVVVQTSNGSKILVLHLQGQVNMPQSLDSPFYAALDILKKYELGKNVAAIFVDFHAETTSEKLCLAHFLDGTVSAVVGTHTHVPSADHQILTGGTAYMTDVGMCGDYDSMLGMNKQPAVNRIVNQFSVKYNKLSPSDGEATICGVFIETDNSSGLAKNIIPIRLGGKLSQCM